MVVFFDKNRTYKNCLAVIKWHRGLTCSKSVCSKQAGNSSHAQNRSRLPITRNPIATGSKNASKKQVYFNSISGYSSSQTVDARVITSKKTDYKSLKKFNGVFKIIRNPTGFFQLATICKIKAWLSGVYPQTSQKHLKKNPDKLSLKKIDQFIGNYF